MPHLDPIAYVDFEACEHLCPDCALKRHGRGPDGFIGTAGSEEDQLGVIALWDDTPGYADHSFADGPFAFCCDACHHIIESITSEGDVPYSDPFITLHELREDWHAARLVKVTDERDALRDERDELRDELRDERDERVALRDERDERDALRDERDELRDELARLRDGIADVRRGLFTLDEILAERRASCL